MTRLLVRPTFTCPTSQNLLWRLGCLAQLSRTIGEHTSKQTLLLPGTAFPRDEVFGDVHVDDLTFLAMVETSNRTFVEDQLRMTLADAINAALGMPMKTPLGEGNFAGTLWDAHLDGHRGKLGFSTCRRATFAPTMLRSLRGCQQGAAGETPRGLEVRSPVPAGASPSSTSASLLARGSPAANLAHSLELTWTNWSLSPSLRRYTRPFHAHSLRGTCGRVSAPSQRTSVAPIVRPVRGAR